MPDIDASGLNEPDVEGEHWIVSKWRPACAWAFIVIVVYDMLLAPLIMQFIFALGNKPYQEWHPNTMLASGMFYVSFGAIIGVSVWNRTQEKLAVFNGPMGGGSFSQQTTTVTGGQSQPPPYQPPPRQPMPPTAPPAPPISDDAALKAADAAIAAQTKAT